MLDEHEARLWADHHLAFGRFVQRIADEIGESFRVLARVQYEQPWRRPAPVRCVAATKSATDRARLK